LQKVLEELSVSRRLDLGCAVRSGAFDATRRGRTVKVEVSSPDAALIFFFTRLLHRLQQVGTVPAIRYFEVRSGLAEQSEEMR
jgi:hypothetical protein